MQIRLTVLGPRSGQADQSGPGARPATACDVLVTAPAGTALAAVASGLAATVAAGDGPAVLYAQSERIDLQRCTLGEPPLVDGAVLSVGTPTEPGPEPADAAAQLHVIAGPDAGGVHLLHGGQVRVGRSAQADVPLDDPDVSRLHCAVTLDPDGRVTVTDLGSTNGTTVDGRPVRDRPVRLPSGSLLRIGESVLRLTVGSGTGGVLASAPDGEGHVRVRVAPVAVPPEAPPPGPASEATQHAYGAAEWGAASGPGEAPVVPHQGGAPELERRRAGTPPRGTTVPRGLRKRGGLSAWARRLTGGRGERPEHGAAADGSRGPEGSYETHGAQGAPGARDAYAPQDTQEAYEEHTAHGPYEPHATHAAHAAHEAHEVHKAHEAHEADRTYEAHGAHEAHETHGAYEAYEAYEGQEASPGRSRAALRRERMPEVWPDAAALLLAALGPGTRLWERGPDHPEALAVRLGTVDRAAPGEDGLLPAVPVTVSLREAGALGIAGPRERLAGVARSVLAQLAALHSPTDLEIVLISTDRARTARERADAWAWLGWLPHLRPAHGQDCRLLLAHDRDQAAARTDELLRRLDDPDTAAQQPEAAGPRTVVVVDGDPGSAALREATVRLARDGARAGIHVVCLAETAAASPSSPVSDTYEAACSVTPAFRACGAAALLSGDVATALWVLRTADGEPAGHGTLAAVDAVSAAWAQRFARALAPLRPDGAGEGAGHARVAAPLPQSARLLDELGLARATPASLMARWADAADDPQALGGRACAVLGAGARGPVSVDLAADGPHLLVEGPPGSGRTELLRSVAASLAAAERPDRLGIVLIDGRDGSVGGAAGLGAGVGPGTGPGTGGGTGGGAGSGSGGAAGAGDRRAGDGLRVCTDLPHVTTHLAVNDPVRMREFAQSLAAELKRRAEVLGRQGFAEWHAGREVSGRLVAQRDRSGEGAVRSGVASASASTAASAAASGPASGLGSGGSGDVESASSSTLRLRPAAARPDPGAPLPRLVVIVDDFDALLAPALGAPGRPAAGSVVRALEAVAREGERLGVHLVAATRGAERTAGTEVGRRAALRVALAAVGGGVEDPAPGRGVLHSGDGRATPFQAGRVTGRIPRTATLRPTVVPLEWERMGDPPTRRPVRELGNGPTDLALLASALDRAARSVTAKPVAPLL
ncbi:FHA domain-containing protein [Streptomyces sp. G45]|uniref:FHA domain-containing protein n=1 Tax=Streptomyces sp. G45 TaxID=3406627 RepID=UPI003C162A4E